MAASNNEPPPGGGSQEKSKCVMSAPLNNTTSSWAEGVGKTGARKHQRSFAEIIADEKANRNILEIVLTKISATNDDGSMSKFRNLTFDEIATFIFETLKVSPADCERFNYSTGRYDTREIMFKQGVDIST